MRSICNAAIAVLFASIRLGAEAALRANTNNGLNLHDPENCSHEEIAAKLHTRNPEAKEVAEYLGYHQWLHSEVMNNKYWTALNNTSHDKLFVRVQGGEFIFWGFKKGDFQMSVYNSAMFHEESYQINNSGNRWNYINPDREVLGRVKETQVLEKGNYVVFTSLFFDQYQHILIDHLGYIAFLRKTLPPETKFIMVDVVGPLAGRGESHGQRLIEFLDPEFASRIHWIKCANMRKCHSRVTIRKGKGSISVFRPPVATRHAQLLKIAREWILSTYRPKPEAFKSKKIVYYTRNHKTAHNGRAMDLQQEQIILKIIEHLMLRFKRPEQLVVFDGSSITLEEQIDLFQSTTVLIGAHGGGLANMLFMLPNAESDRCEDRPKVLEFVTSSATPQVQDGLRWMTYYNMYASCAWVEFHNVLYASGSTSETTYLDLDHIRDALVNILGGDNHRSGVVAS